MLVDTPEDWAGLRAAGLVVRLTLDALEQALRPGITTRELDAVAAEVFERHGARSAPALSYGFPGTVLVSVNEEVVHGVPGPRRINAGDVVKIDVTAEKDGYIADAARTVVIGEASAVASRLVQCAERAFGLALGVAEVGRKVNEISRVVQQEVRRCGFDVMHGLTGHGVGRRIHEAPDVPNQFNPRQQDVLTDGLVIAIEPMISAGSGKPVQDRNGWTIRAGDGSLTAHYEHTVVITRDGPVILTGAAPSMSALSR
jgi:methionyl aminopeptidase